MLSRLASWLKAACTKAWTTRGGAAAVEFAVVFPVALFVYVGASELSDAVNTSRKVETVSRTIVDLLSQQPTSSQTSSTPTPATAVSAATLQSLMTAAAGLLYPATTTPLQMTLSAIDLTNNSSGYCCNAYVRWSYTQNGSLRPCNTQLTLASASAAPTPTSIPVNLVPVIPGYALPSPIAILVSDVAYVYQPIFKSSYISFATGMSRTSYMLPRSVGQVITQSPLPTTGPQTGVVCY